MNTLKKLVLTGLLALSLGACSTFNQQMYGQTEVDASGPEPSWAVQPEKAIRLALESSQHVFISTATGDTLPGLVDSACAKAIANASQSGITAKMLTSKNTWWDRTRGLAGDRFTAKCELSTESTDTSASAETPVHRDKRRVIHRKSNDASDFTN